MDRNLGLAHRITEEVLFWVTRKHDTTSAIPEEIARWVKLYLDEVAAFIIYDTEIKTWDRDKLLKALGAESV